MNKSAAIKSIVFLWGTGFLFSCSSYCSDSQKPIPNIEKEWSEHFVIDNGRVLQDSTLFSGYIVAYQEGRLIARTGYLDGRQHGDMLLYYPDGSLKQRRPYVHGEKHGEHLGYHPSGQLAFKYYFVNGKSEGTHFEWYEDGHLRAEMNYADGYELGQQRVWRPDGKLRSNYITRENGRQYGMLGIKRCTKIDSETGDLDPYTGKEK